MVQTYFLNLKEEKLSAMFGQIYTMYEGYFNINNVLVDKVVSSDF